MLHSGFIYRLIALIVFWALNMQAATAQTLERMAGQMIVTGFSGDDLSDQGVKAIIADLEAGRLGGVMYLKFNVQSSARVAAMNAAFYAASGAIAPLITIDQEGGLVERLTADIGFQEVPSAKRVAESLSVGGASELYGTMASSIQELGFNVNFGPVVDLDLNAANPVIGKFGRSFGSNADIVSQYASAFVSAHKASGVLTALKHFPGHGSSADDSHEGFVDISSSWKEIELSPYRNLVGNDRIDMVMAGHLFVDRIGGDSGTLPASLSRAWLTDKLRNEIGFDGVVISDDMEMGAIRNLYSNEQAIVQAVLAGTDILLFSNTANSRTSLAAEVQAILVKYANTSPEFRARVEESYARIMEMKARL